MQYLENKTVVVPFDFSDQSTQAVDKAIEIAEETTSIHVVHVIDPTPIMVSMDPALPVPASYDHGRYEQALQELKKRFGEGQYARLKLHCAVGDPGSVVTDYANTIHANMIIMPSHGRTGISRLLMGSVAERVLRLAHCPVLVLREPKSK